MRRTLEAVNLEGRWAMFSDGMVVRVILADDEFDETDNVDEATYMVITSPPGCDKPFFARIPLDSYESTETH